MLRFFRYLLLALVLVTVFLAAAMTAMRFAIHGREVDVPRLVGLTPGEAERTANANGLLLYVENRFYSADIPEGRIMSQLPPPGERVRRGWKVRVAQSLGPQRAAIPDVVGQSARAAQINLTRRGLELGTVATVRLPNAPNDQVLAQSPPAEAVGVASPKVSLLMTAPPEEKPPYYVMPSFVGRRYGDATSAMAVAGFKVGHVTVRPKSAASANPKLKPIATDTVATQSPDPGQKVGAGASISFELVR